MHQPETDDRAHDHEYCTEYAQESFLRIHRSISADMDSAFTLFVTLCWFYCKCPLLPARGVDGGEVSGSGGRMRGARAPERFLVDACTYAEMAGKTPALQFCYSSV